MTGKLAMRRNRDAFRWHYRTPGSFSDIVMTSDGKALTGLYFVGSRKVDGEEHDLPAFREACRWLDVYFGGRPPDFTPSYAIQGLTPFRRDVMEEMLKIPFGGTVTYGGIARAIARRRGLARMSAQAVGGAVGWNPICLIIPCHRVIGADGGLTGYGGGMANKIALLALEASAASACRESAGAPWARIQHDDRQ